MMCRDRGYAVDTTETAMSLEDFKLRFGDSPSIGHHPTRPDLNFVLQKENDPSDQIRAFFLEELKVGVKGIRECKEQMVSNGIHTAILVIQNSLTPSASKAIVECCAAGFVIQDFTEAQLVVNITHHELVPRHVLLDDAEKKELLERYKLKESQLPRLRPTDPVARYYGARKGQVMKIVRPSPTAGRYVTYRLVH